MHASVDVCCHNKAKFESKSSFTRAHLGERAAYLEAADNIDNFLVSAYCHTRTHTHAHTHTHNGRVPGCTRNQLLQARLRWVLQWCRHELAAVMDARRVWMGAHTAWAHAPVAHPRTPRSLVRPLLDKSEKLFGEICLRGKAWACVWGTGSCCCCCLTFIAGSVSPLVLHCALESWLWTFATPFQASFCSSNRLTSSQFPLFSPVKSSLKL